MIMLDTAVTDTTTLLVYDDLEAVHEYLVRVFGLTAGPLTRDDRGAVVHGEVRAGAAIMSPPVDRPYGVREYGARDPEGQLWYFHAPLA
jgi:hypothetical protein